MIYAGIKNKEAQKHLDGALEASKDKKWYRRLKIIALSAKKAVNEKLHEMAQDLNTDLTTIDGFMWFISKHVKFI